MTNGGTIFIAVFSSYLVHQDSDNEDTDVRFLESFPYEEVINGTRTRMQDLWTDITPNSHTLTESHEISDGVMKPYVVSHSTRQ